MPPSTFTVTGTFQNPDGSTPGAGSSVTFTPVGRSTPASTVVPAKPITVTLTSTGAPANTLIIPASTTLVAGVAYNVQENIVGVTPVPAPYVLPSQSGGATIDLSTITVSYVLAAGTALRVIKIITANTSAGATDEYVMANASSGALTYTLPTAVGNSQVYTVKKTDSSANAVTIATTGGQTIDGASTLVINVRNQSFSLVSDGSNWNII